MTCKVSVIIPTYKRSNLIKRAIDSVLNQSYLNIEIVVVDDNLSGSAEQIHTFSMLKEYILDNKIIYIQNLKSMGGALSRNIGIMVSSGDFVTFLDDDDIYLRDKIKVQVEFMISQSVEMSFANVYIFNSNDSLVDVRDHSYIKSTKKSELLKKHLMHHLTPTATYMYKREALIRINGFDNVKMGQEFILMLKTIESDVTIGYLPTSGVIQYLHDGERISLGENKESTAIQQYNLKKKYFPFLNYSERRFIAFRLNLVLFYVSLKKKNYLSVLKYSLRLLVFPINCLKFLRIRLRFNLSKFEIMERVNNELKSSKMSKNCERG